MGLSIVLSRAGLWSSQPPAVLDYIWTTTCRSGFVRSHVQDLLGGLRFSSLERLVCRRDAKPERASFKSSVGTSAWRIADGWNIGEAQVAAGLTKSRTKSVPLGDDIRQLA